MYHAEKIRHDLSCALRIHRLTLKTAVINITKSATPRQFGAAAEVK
jgi:hypothetical protein